MPLPKIATMPIASLEQRVMSAAAPCFEPDGCMSEVTFERVMGYFVEENELFCNQFDDSSQWQAMPPLYQAQIDSGCCYFIL